MNRDIKTQWVAALRSGEYHQGSNALKKENMHTNTICYCCLGVLTDLYAKENNITFSCINDNLKAVGGEEFLCSDVMEWAGLDNKNPTVNDSDIDSRALSDYNDNEYSFAEIATLIEENL